MAENKTKANDASVEEFLNAVPDEKKRADSFRLVQIMREETGEEPVMWGDSIVGFGSYHYHYASEELLVVLDGEPELRDPDGWRRLSAGEVVSFPAGEEGGHQIANRSDSTVRIMLVSEMNFPDVVVLPDSGKVSSFTGPPDAEGTFWHTSSMEDGVAYMDGESPPGDPGPR